MTHVVVLPGDGIGPEVAAQAIRVLDALETALSSTDADTRLRAAMTVSSLAMLDELQPRLLARAPLMDLLRAVGHHARVADQRDLFARGLQRAHRF